MPSPRICAIPSPQAINRLHLQQVISPKTHLPQQNNKTNDSRIWAAIKREALLTVSEGIASPKEVDDIFKEVLKTPKGPCEQMDVVGLDVVLDIEEHYAETREGLPEAPRELLRKMIADKKLGVKSGEGFFKYGAEKK